MSDMRAYSSQFTPGMAPSMIVGLSQNWPLLGPMPIYSPVPNYAAHPLPLVSLNGAKLFNLSLNGHTFSSFSSLIQDFGDKWTGPGSQAAATLANQLFSDNNELVYVLITDVASYPITSKPELWQLSREEEEQQYQVPFSLPNNGNNPLEKTIPISFSTLFNVGQEIFALFVFSPTQVLFTLETTKQQGLASVFFHGLSQVSVSVAQNPRVINIHFLE
ncbi:hypothetical protein Ocin01_07590 [Orchesella cincta]|uniref:Uncharacterized protein n=1 Tax=Orchesella cincta TaxID=48709 RepID=A0A1D2N1B3_ORCCI|nr:hypothetical protein Ocin01_07590 [Orchesella cincta]